MDQVGARPAFEEQAVRAAAGHERLLPNRAPRTSHPAKTARARALRDTLLWRPAAVLRRRQRDPRRQHACVSNPIGSCWRLIELRTSSAAPASTIITSAACAPISNCRIHGFSDPPSAPLPSPRSSVSAFARRLPRRQQADEHRAAEDQRQGGREHRRSASPSRAEARRRARADQHRQRPPRDRQAGHTAERGQHQALGQHLADMRPRPAPIAARMASSRDRAASRASNRLATLPQAISSTRPTAASRTRAAAGSRRRGTCSALSTRRPLAIHVRMIDRDACATRTNSSFTCCRVTSLCWRA